MQSLCLEPRASSVGIRANSKRQHRVSNEPVAGWRLQGAAWPRAFFVAQSSRPDAAAILSKPKGLLAWNSIPSKSKRPCDAALCADRPYPPPLPTHAFETDRQRSIASTLRLIGHPATDPDVISPLGENPAGGELPPADSAPEMLGGPEPLPPLPMAPSDVPKVYVSGREFGQNALSFDVAPPLRTSDGQRPDLETTGESLAFPLGNSLEPARSFPTALGPQNKLRQTNSDTKQTQTPTFLRSDGFLVAAAGAINWAKAWVSSFGLVSVFAGRTQFGFDRLGEPPHPVLRRRHSICYLGSNRHSIRFNL